MDFDQYPFDGSQSPATQPHFFADVMSDDEPDEWFADEPHVDILAVTDVLTQGMDFDSAAAIASTHAQPASINVDLPTALGHYNGLLTSPMSPPLSPILPSHVLFSEQSVLPAPPQVTTSGNQQANAPVAPQNWLDTNGVNNHHGQAVHQAVHHPALHLNAMSFNPNATPLGPENHNLPDFLRYWAYQSNSAWHGINSRERGRYPWTARISAQMTRNVSNVGYNDLAGDRCDVQGIDWEDLGVTRSEARERRLNTYKNYVNIPDSDRWQVSEAVDAHAHGRSLRTDCSADEPRHATLQGELL